MLWILGIVALIALHQDYEFEYSTETASQYIFYPDERNIVVTPDMEPTNKEGTIHLKGVIRKEFFGKKFFDGSISINGIEFENITLKANGEINSFSHYIKDDEILRYSIRFKWKMGINRFDGLKIDITHSKNNHNPILDRISLTTIIS